MTNASTVEETGGAFDYGAEAELWFDSHHLQLFDAESGESLLAPTGTGNGSAQAPPAASSASTPS